MNKKVKPLRNDLLLKPTIDDIGLSEEDSDNMGDSDFKQQNKGGGKFGLRLADSDSLQA